MAASSPRSTPLAANSTLLYSSLCPVPVAASHQADGGAAEVHAEPRRPLLIVLLGDMFRTGGQHSRPLSSPKRADACRALDAASLIRTRVLAPAWHRGWQTTQCAFVTSALPRPTVADALRAVEPAHLQVHTVRPGRHQVESVLEALLWCTSRTRVGSTRPRSSLLALRVDLHFKLELRLPRADALEARTHALLPFEIAEPHRCSGLGVMRRLYPRRAQLPAVGPPCRVPRVSDVFFYAPAGRVRKVFEVLRAHQHDDHMHDFARWLGGENISCALQQGYEVCGAREPNLVRAAKCAPNASVAAERIFVRALDSAGESQSDPTKLRNPLYKI
eukprot:757601-Prymnesium_polylepis.1